MTIPSITVSFGTIDTFPPINTPNYSSVVETVCNQHKTEVDKLNDLISQLNLYKNAVNQNKDDFTTDIATFTTIKDQILASEPYMNTEKVNEIKAEMDLIDLVAADADLIQDTADLVRSVTINYKSKSADYTAEHNDFIYADTSAGSFTITVPQSPENNDKFYILDAKSTFKNNNLIVSGGTIMGQTSLELDINNLSIGLVFNGTEWRIF